MHRDPRRDDGEGALPAALRALLERVAAGEVALDEAARALRTLPFEDLDGARLDHHRALRKGFPEVVFCEGKTPEQVGRVVARLAETGPRVLATRASPAHYEAAAEQVPDLRYDDVARMLWIDREPIGERLDGVVVVSAGTSDLPVAREAELTLELLGHAPARLDDVGVAGIHRLLNELPELQRANVIIAVAGMEGALPGVVAGLVPAPVIAVPTSVGYGTGLDGLAALLGMLNSCAPGLSVVNIDNGFGAGYQAATINRRMR